MIKRASFLIAVGFAGFLALGVSAQTPGPMPQGQQPPERAMAEYPPWVAQPPVRSEGLTVIRLLPSGQTPQDFSQAITIERYEAEHRSPKDYVLSRAESSRKTCDGMLMSDVDERTVNGYKTATLRFTCTRSQRNNKSGAVTVTAISGRDALHVLSWFWLGPPVAANQLVPVPPAVIAQWDAFTRTITVCDIRDSNHPCPVRPGK